MCTVIVRVPSRPGAEPVRLLAVRDEDPSREWRDLGHWWDEQPEVRGVRDELAGGAWLAADDERLAVLLNREGFPDVDVPTTRGRLVLDAVASRQLPASPTTLGFNLVEASADGVRVSSWTGSGAPRVVDLAEGTHMIAHDDVDDPRTARVVSWLDAFAEADTDGAGEGPWWAGWLEVLARSAGMPPTDDRAIIRDNRPHGVPTLSLLVAVASVSRTGVDVRTAALDEPGRWKPLSFGSE